jgi:hypothetical protein
MGVFRSVLALSAAMVGSSALKDKKERTDTAEIVRALFVDYDRWPELIRNQIEQAAWQT